MRETITLELGSYACYVGSHYWNIQAETIDAAYDMDDESFQAERLFRTVGMGADAHYRPRAIVTDLRENLGYMEFERAGRSKTEFHLGNDSRYEHEDTGLWGGTVTKLTHEDTPKMSPFQAFLRSTEPPHGSGHHHLLGSGSSLAPAICPISATEGTREVSRVALERTISKWTEFSHAALHETNMYTLPTWCASSTFDNFLTGGPNFENSVISNAYFEGYMEKLRVEAEDCDNLSTVQIFADSFDGFAGMTASIVEEIRQEYRGVTMPVFALSRAPTSSSLSQVKGQLQSLSMPYFYSKVSDFADVVVPITINDWDQNWKKSPLKFNTKSMYHTSAIVASALEALLGCTYLPRPGDGDVETSAADTYTMIHQATAGARVKLCHLETHFPVTIFPDADHENFLDEMSGASSPAVVSGNNDGTRAETRRRMNASMCSLSTASYGSWSFEAESRSDSAKMDRAQYTCISNVQRIRGPTNPDLPRRIYERCERGKYYVTSCIQRQSALYLPKSFPHFFTDCDEFGFHLQENALGWSSVADEDSDPHGCMSVAQMSSLGADTNMGRHVLSVANFWDSYLKGSTRSTVLQSQVNKAGLSDEEAEEITQSLLDLQSGYFNE